MFIIVRTFLVVVLIWKKPLTNRVFFFFLMEKIVQIKNPNFLPRIVFFFFKNENFNTSIRKLKSNSQFWGFCKGRGAERGRRRKEDVSIEVLGTQVYLKKTLYTYWLNIYLKPYSLWEYKNINVLLKFHKSSHDSCTRPYERKIYLCFPLKFQGKFRIYISPKT